MKRKVSLFLWKIILLLRCSLKNYYENLLANKKGKRFKKVKKLIFLFLSLFIFTPFCFASDEYINELGVMMNKKELTNLKNLGFSQREIETMSRVV